MLGLLQDFLISAVPFVVILGVVVTIHELGHFLAAKSLGVAVDRFSIGFGKAIASWRDKSGVEWRVGWIPLGGYVQFSGDENAASVPDDSDLQDLKAKVVASEGAGALQRYFHFKPLWQRAVVVAAGPMANFLLAITIFALVFMTLGAPTPSVPRVEDLKPGMPAVAAGFKRGDLIVQANGKDIKVFEDLQNIVEGRAGLPTTFVVERAGARVVLTATPRAEVVEDRAGGPKTVGLIGVGPARTFTRERLNPAAAAVAGVKQTWEVLATTVSYLGHLFRGQVSADGLSGPIGIAHMSGEVAKMGAAGETSFVGIVLGSLAGLAMLTAIISVSIGFMNLLPIPVLDGGHLLFYAYEAVVRRPLGAKVQAAGYRVGLALVLGLMLFATWNDLQRLRVFKFLGGLLS